MYALAEQRIFCSEKMVLKIGIFLIAVAVFLGQDVSNSAYSAGALLKGYIVKEHCNNALFLLEQTRESQLIEKYKGFAINKLEKGVYYIRMNKIINKRNIKINVAEIDRKLNPEIEITPKLANENIHAKTNINKFEENTILAINGTYFKQNTGTPLGALVIDEEIITGPIYERVGFGIGKDEFKTSRLAFNGTLKNKHREIEINNINQPRMLYSDVLLYTEKWGERSAETKTNYKQIAIRDNKIVATSSYPLFIPENGFVISAPAEKLEGFELGDKISLEYSLIPKWKNIEHIVSGGPYLLKEGEIFIDTAAEKLNSIAGRNPRTAIGYTKDNVMIMVTVDGRKEGTSGVTLKELALIMDDLGCYEAINLDGGSSTVMYADGKILSGSNVKSASISNAIVVRNKV